MNSSPSLVQALCEPQGGSLRSLPAAPGGRTSNHLLKTLTQFEPAGQRRALDRGSRLVVDGRTVWFPTTSVLMSCAGDPESLTNWADYRGAAGLPELLRGPSHTTSWTVEVSGEAFAVRRSELTRLLQSQPRFGLAVMCWLAETIAEAQRLAVSNRIDTVPQRLAKLLLKLDGYHGHATKIPMTQAGLADLLGVQRTTVCSALAPLKARQTIRVSRGGLWIDDRTSLLKAVGL